MVRYRHVSYRYAMIVTTGEPGPLGDVWRAGRLGVVLAQPRWRPATDVYETAAAFTVLVELAGVEQDGLDVLLFEDAVLIEGQRQLPVAEEHGVYQAAEIRQGPFRAEVSLPVAIDPTGVEARYEEGILRIVLPKARASEHHGG
jgi:HSP20 family protein